MMFRILKRPCALSLTLLGQTSPVLLFAGALSLAPGKLSHGARRMQSSRHVTTMDCVSFAQVEVGSPSEMERAGAFFGADAEVGDTVLLRGDLGTGKTCFARGFIRARVGNPDLPVTSPSYLLDNTYEVQDEDVTLHHMDLYRLQGGADLQVLDIPSVLKTSVCLIEWPDRLGEARPVDRLDVHLAAVSEDKRTVTFTGYGAWWAGVVDGFQEAFVR